MPFDDTQKNNTRLALEKTTVKISTTSGFKGTGFFITPDGYILTAWHCISETIPLSTTITVETFAGEILKNVQLDQEKSLPGYDIAALKIEHTTKDCVPLGLITEEHKGGSIIAVGYPAAYIEGRGIGVYDGIINQLLKLPETNIEAFETNAIEGQGQSGGLIYHVATQRLIGLATDIYNNDVTKTTGIAVRFDKLFEKWPKIMPLSERLSSFIHKTTEKRNSIRPIWKEVTKYLTRLKKIGIGEEDKYILLDIEDFLANEITPQEFIESWQQDSQSTQPIKYDILAKRLKNSEIALFLGSSIPEQLAPQLADSFEFKGSFSEICEYIELNNDYSRNTLRHEIQNLLNGEEAPLLEPLYQLLANLQSPIVVIYSGYDKLLENTFKKCDKKFAVISHSQDGNIIVQCSDKSAPEICRDNDKLSGLDLFEDDNGYSLIYKINGCISSIPNNVNQKDALLLAEHDYFNFAKSIDKSIPNYVIGHLNGRDLWLLGQYPQSWENRLIMQAILERRAASNNTITAIHKDADEFAKTYWQAKNVNNYPIELEEFVQNLQNYI